MGKMTFRDLLTSCGVNQPETLIEFLESFNTDIFENLPVDEKAALESDMNRVFERLGG